MPNHILDNNKVYFRQSNLPPMWGVAFRMLEIYVITTGDKRYPYSVEITESEFLSAIEMAEEL